MKNLTILLLFTLGACTASTHNTTRGRTLSPDREMGEPTRQPADSLAAPVAPQP